MSFLFIPPFHLSSLPSLPPYLGRATRRVRVHSVRLFVGGGAHHPGRPRPRHGPSCHRRSCQGEGGEEEGLGGGGGKEDDEKEEDSGGSALARGRHAASRPARGSLRRRNLLRGRHDDDKVGGRWALRL